MNVLALLTLGSVLLAAAFAAPPNLKIFNGEDADIKDFPYTVSVYYRDFMGFCGGSILNENTILTAAYCFIEIDPILEVELVKVRFGNKNNSVAHATNVTKIYVHEDWDDSSPCPSGDIAVLKIDPPLVFSDTVQPVRLPQLHEATPVNKVAVSTGWGYTQDLYFAPVLQKVNLTVFSDQDCQNLWNDDCQVDSTYKLCAQADMSDRKPRGVCAGDSGGPLVIEGTQYGIVADSGTCGNPSVRPVFTKVSGYIDWLENKL